jgi:hypothetical protein
LVQLLLRSSLVQTSLLQPQPTAHQELQLQRQRQQQVTQ